MSGQATKGSVSCGMSLEAANAFVQNDRERPQDVRLKVNGGVMLPNGLLQPSVHVLSRVLVLKARAVPEVRVYILVELIVSNLTEAEHGEVVEVEGHSAVFPEPLSVHLVILAGEVRVGPSNIVETELQAHGRLSIGLGHRGRSGVRIESRFPGVRMHLIRNRSRDALLCFALLCFALQCYCRPPPLAFFL